MSREVLDTLYIDFKSKGVQEVRTQILSLEKALEALQDKNRIQSDKFNESFSRAFKKITDSANLLGKTVQRVNTQMIHGARSATKAYYSQAAALRQLRQEFAEIGKLSKSMNIGLGARGATSGISGYGGSLSSRNLGNLNKFLRLQVLKRQIRLGDERIAGQHARNAQAREYSALRMEKSRFMFDVLKRKEDWRLEKIMIARKKAAERGGVVEGKDDSASSSLAAAGVLLRGAAIKLMAVAGVLYVGYKLYKKGIDERTKNQLYYNKLFLSGIDNARAVNAGVNIARYGGTKEEILDTLQALSTSLGAMTRGDTALIEHLGKYGIGGISPRMTSEDIIEKVRTRIARGDLSKNEINALLAKLPLTEAGKMSVIEGHPLFEGEMKAFEQHRKNQEALVAARKAEIDILLTLNDTLAKTAELSKKISEGISMMADAINDAFKFITTPSKWVPFWNVADKKQVQALAAVANPQHPNNPIGMLLGEMSRGLFSGDVTMKRVSLGQYGWRKLSGRQVGELSDILYKYGVENENGLKVFPSVVPLPYAPDFEGVKSLTTNNISNNQKYYYMYGGGVNPETNVPYYLQPVTIDPFEAY